MASEKQKLTTSTITKIVITLLVIVLSIFFIFGLIGRAFQTLFKNQARRVDKMMSKLIITGVVNNDKDFTRIANKKSQIFFFKHSFAPISLLLIVFIMWVTCMSINNWSEAMFPLFGRMLYPWEGVPTYVAPLGFDFSSVTANYVDMSNWFSIMTLITILLFFVGLIWYFFEVGGFIARHLRIQKLSRTMFSQNLDNVDLSTFLRPTNQEVIPSSTITQPATTNQIQK